MLRHEPEFSKIGIVPEKKKNRKYLIFFKFDCKKY